ncbi:ImmA/IrrE family metallo-endopeptidase [Lentibacillus saliphilus]|uniref:ImmA/IrrE family metallo-endopeptidase n=1 Tax=Lentibacillus saliphilus TaxID=2737028 RepID=UPI001C3119F7|nr:ImmA/IrrE family metallo-endopeptidase [Lentibacillus saliphilus]
MHFERLLKEANSLGIDVDERPLKGHIKGLYCDNVIWINKDLPTLNEKYCVLAEELGHYHTSVGDILDQSKLSNRKQEQRARSWAYERIVPLSKIVQAHKEHIRNRFELAEFLGVTETFLEFALDRYKEKYGIAINFNGYTICFEPLGVIEWFDKKF